MPYGLINYTLVYTGLEKYTRNLFIYKKCGKRGIGRCPENLYPKPMIGEIFDFKATRGVWPIAEKALKTIVRRRFDPVCLGCGELLTVSRGRWAAIATKLCVAVA